MNSDSHCFLGHRFVLNQQDIEYPLAERDITVSYASWYNCNRAISTACLISA